VLAAAGQATERLSLGTGVTCPLIRIHLAIVAQAAATTAALLPGRLFLGLGTGEHLNEHILGDRWPPARLRLEMLDEAIGLIRELWKGDLTTHRGRHYTVEHARLYTLPERPPPIMVAARGERAATLAGEKGDGLIGTSPDAAMMEAFEDAGGTDKPRYGQLTVCWAPSLKEARRTAFEVWPTMAVRGELSVELPLPRHFEQAAEMVDEDDVAEAMVLGPDPEEFLAAIHTFAGGGYTHVYLHQVGPDQEGFLTFCRDELLPKLG